MNRVFDGAMHWLRGLTAGVGGLRPSDGKARRSSAQVALSADITQRSQTSFYYAFFFLTPARRQALNDVYAYCRLIDDIVDEPGATADKARALHAWRGELQAAFFDGQPTHPVAHGLQLGQRQFGLRYEDALAVLTGCENDLTKRRYATWDEVYDYCYHVASSVGLLCIELFGCTDPQSRDYAIHLGRALQLTNILRDIREDAERDRLYLPLEALAECGLTEHEVMSGQLPAAKRAAATRLLQLVSDRAHDEYRLARNARKSGDRRALLPAEIMGQVYFSLLQELESRGLEILQPKVGQRIALSKRQKLTAALTALIHTLLPTS